jgi:nitrogen regulatory protein PII
MKPAPALPCRRLVEPAAQNPSPSNALCCSASRCGRDQPSQEGGVFAGMKLITAIIKPFKLDQVREALMSNSVQGITVSEVRGYGRQEGQAEVYRGAEYNLNLVPKLKIELVVEDQDAARIVDAILLAAHSGAVGDGKIFVSDIGHAVRIRTGEVDETAI